MNLAQIQKFCFFISFSIIIIGALFKIFNWPFANMLLFLGLLLFAIFIIISIYEIINSNKIDGTEKFMWIIGLLFFGFIVGFIYMLFGKKKI